MKMIMKHTTEQVAGMCTEVDEAKAMAMEAIAANQRYFVHGLDV